LAATLAMLAISAAAARRARRGASRAVEPSRRVGVVAQRTASSRRSPAVRPRPSAERRSTGALLPPPRPAPTRSETTGDNGELWDPVEVPLPLYLSKAKAPRTVRTVELGSPGTWSSGRLTGREQEARSVESRDVLLDASEPTVREVKDPVPESAPRRAVGD
jgi:hypothetical protein